jgi:hypothetical protein
LDTVGKYYFVDHLSKRSTYRDPRIPKTEVVAKARALYEYRSQSEGKLALKEGDVVGIIEDTKGERNVVNEWNVNGNG